MPRPTSADAPAPTASTFFVSHATLSLAGLSCAEYGATEEALLITALAVSLRSVSEHNIGATSCADDAARRRTRRLFASTDAVAISFAISLSTSNFASDASASD